MDMFNSKRFRTRGYIDPDRAIILYKKHLKKKWILPVKYGNGLIWIYGTDNLLISMICPLQ